MFNCELALDRQYDLVDAYTRFPHIQFLNCQTLDDLQSFTRAWGPLYLTSIPDERALGKAARRIDECKAHRRWLQALKGMIEACRGREDARRALAEFLAAEVDIDRTSNIYRPGQDPIFHDLLRLQLNYEGDSVVWANSAEIDSVRKALIFCVESYVSAPIGCVRVEERRKGFEIKASFSLPSLWDAMKWMIWLDEWNGWPPPACLECHKIFPQLTAHERKYCSRDCAHRATNRKWRRRDLRQRKAKARMDGGRDVPRKAR